MTIFRVNHEKNYTVINNYICTDARLSWRAKGIWLYAFSRPDDWTFNLRDLINQSTDGEDSVRSGLKELEKTGYLCRSQKQGKDGKFEKADWEFYEKPRELKIKVPKGEKPDSVNPDSVNPTLLNTDTILSTKERIHTPPSHSVSQEAKDCVCFFSSFLEKEGTHITDLQRKHWTKDFTAMHEVDKIPWDEIKKIIEYAHLDDFWQSRTLTAKNIRKNALTIKLQMKQAKKAPNEDHGFENGKIYGKYVCEIDDKEIHFRNLENGTFEYLLFSDKDFAKNLKGLCKRLKITS